MTNRLFPLLLSVPGISNVYIHMCKHLGACTPEEVQSTAIVHGVGSPSRPSYQVGPGFAIQAVSDLLKCFGPIIRYSFIEGVPIGIACSTTRKSDICGVFRFSAV